jgi:amino acid adenylation domain-containing protein
MSWIGGLLTRSYFWRPGLPITPFSVKFDFDYTLGQLLAEIKNQLRKHYRHQRYPLGKIMRDLNLGNDRDRLFNISLSYEKHDYSNSFRDTITKVDPLSNRNERVGLAVYVREFDPNDDVRLDFDYNLNCFSKNEVEAIASHINNLLQRILQDKNKQIFEFIYLNEQEENKLLVDFNNTRAPLPSKSVVDFFQMQVLRTPSKTAIKDDNEFYTYLDVDVLSDQIASRIKEINLSETSPIAVLLDRSCRIILSLIGILKSGRPFLPIDPMMPSDRRDFILKNSETKTIITDRPLSTDYPAEVFLLDELLQEKEFSKGLETSISLSNAAYVIYTSGSTGNPKGVEVTHRSLINLLTSIQSVPGVSEDDILFSVTTYSFDISLLEFLCPLISGASVYLVSKETIMNPNELIKKLAFVQPTLIQGTPSFFNLLVNNGWKGDKKLRVFCGGELLSEALAEKLIKSCSEVWNMYGPTETTIWSSFKKIQEPKDASNIGKPINNTQFYILDEFKMLQPIGIAGKLFIGGTGLATGYYRNELLTRQRFIKNPYQEGALFYDTGDLGKWSEEGEVFFLGRTDSQVKIRGFRVELEEIEKNILLFSQKINQIVVAVKEYSNEKSLVAYLVSDNRIDKIELRKHLKSKLPDYMIPNFYVQISALPLTPNGKIDKRNLPAATENDLIKSHHDKPVSEAEELLLQLWSDTLGINTIGVSDNFFELGGHSLLAIRMINSVKRQLNYDVDLRDFFKSPTIQSLAELIQNLPRHFPFERIPISSKEEVNLTPSQRNLWIASQRVNVSRAYNMSLAYTVFGNLQIEILEQAIEMLAHDHEIFRTNFYERDGFLFQKVSPFERGKFKIQSGKAEPKENLETQINELAYTQFDLEKDFLIRMFLLRGDVNQTILLFSTHHMIMDGMSFELFINELILHYDKLSKREEINLAPRKVQFRDYSDWLEKEIVSDDRSASYWLNELNSYKAKPSFAYDYNFKTVATDGKKYTFEISRASFNKLKDAALKGNRTEFALLTSLVTILINRYSEHEDICIGTVISGRDHPDIMEAIGMFAKTVIVRTKLSSNSKLIDILDSVQSKLNEIDRFQNMPFSQINPAEFFDALIVWQPSGQSLKKIVFSNDLQFEAYPMMRSICRVPIAINLFEGEVNLVCEIDYNIHKYKPRTIQLLAQSLISLINELVHDPTMELKEINLFPDRMIESVSASNINFHLD